MGLSGGEPRGALAHHHKCRALPRGRPSRRPTTCGVPSRPDRPGTGWLLGVQLAGGRGANAGAKTATHVAGSNYDNLPTRFVVSGLTGKRFTVFKASLWKGLAGSWGCATSVLQGLIMPEVQALIRANLRLGGEHAFCVPGAGPHPAAFPWRVISRVLRHSRACRV